MAGINHRYKNPIHDPSTSRATNIGRLRASIRSLQKQAFPPRIGRAKPGGRVVMGRALPFGRGRVGGVESTASESPERTLRPTFGARLHSPPVSPTPKGSTSSGRMTIDDLLSDGNLAGLPEKYRREAMRECRSRETASHADGEEGVNVDADVAEGDGRSVTSDDPLLLYPRWEKRESESMVQEHQAHRAHPHQSSSVPATSSHSECEEPHTPSNHVPINPIPAQSSESGWQEPGTLSSFPADGEYEEDFDVARDRFSDGGDEEEELDMMADGDSADGWRTDEEDGGGDEDIDMEENMDRRSDVATRLAHRGEVSRFFSNPPGNKSHETTNSEPRPPAVSATVAIDSAVGTWPPSTVASAFRGSERSVDVGPAARGAHVGSLVAESELVRDSLSLKLGTEGRDGQASGGPNKETSGDDCSGTAFDDSAQPRTKQGATRSQASCLGRTGSFPEAAGTSENGLDGLLDSVLKPAQRCKVWKPRTILYSNSPDSPLRAVEPADFDICDHAVRDDPTGTQVLQPRPLGFEAGLDYPALTNTGDATHYKRWYRSTTAVDQELFERQDTDIESFGSEPGMNIEQAAFQEIWGDSTEVDDSSDEETEKDASDDENAFQMRLFGNFVSFRTEGNVEHSPKDHPFAFGRQMELLPWSQHTQTQERRRSSRIANARERETFGLRDAGWPVHSIRSWDRYLSDARQERTGDAWLYENPRREPESWQVFGDGNDEELLGEDGFPYVFEPVASEMEGRSFAIERGQVDGNTRADGFGIVRDMDENPFLERQTNLQGISDLTTMQPILDEVPVTYNYPDVRNSHDMEVSPEVRAFGSIAFEEEEILREVTIYLENLSQAFAKAMAESEFASPEMAMDEDIGKDSPGFDS